MRQPTRPQDYKTTFLLPSLFILLFGTCVRAQNFTSYFTGNATDFDTIGQRGVCLMGGASENDNAMRWFLQRANGGDVVVLRTSGSDGYNDYLYSDLGVPINSVRTIVFHSGAAAGAMEVREALAGAEAIWFAGGNQATYVDYWQNTAVDSLINAGVRDRGVVVGGTSAGMAILGGVRFTAENGTITSEEALADPYDERITLDYDRFIHLNALYGIITDTHFDNPDRRGRLLTFLARAIHDPESQSLWNTRAIACDEYTAVCIEPNNIARIFGSPDEEDYAYFVEYSCRLPTVGTELPEQLSPGQPLSWTGGFGNYIVACRVRGTTDGSATFPLGDLNNFLTAEYWEYWSALDGEFLSIPSDSLPNGLPDCGPNSVSETIAEGVSFYPNPTNQTIKVSAAAVITQYRIVDVTGRSLLTGQPNQPQFEANVSTLPAGPYVLTLTGTDWRTSAHFMVIH